MPLMLVQGHPGRPAHDDVRRQRAARRGVRRGSEEVGNSTCVREPVGVVAAITPWNYPLHQIANKVAAALAAGCTVVVKPSEVAPINAFILADIIDEVGLPEGVFNLVIGRRPGRRRGDRRAPARPTWSRSPARREPASASWQLAAEMVKKVSLELGGKSANIILEGADFAKAVPDGVFKCYLNSGQTCSALTRMVVPRARLAEVEDLAVGHRGLARPGRPDHGVESARTARERRSSSSACATTSTRGSTRVPAWSAAASTPPEGLEQGYYVQPTIFSDVTQRHDHRARGDLRPGALDHPLRHRGRGHRHRQRLALRARRRRLGRDRREGVRGRAQDCAPGRSRSTAARSTRRAVRRLQAVRASAASSATTASKSSSRSRRSSTPSPRRPAPRASTGTRARRPAPGG